MKITINRLIFNNLHDGKRIYLPSVGTLWLKDNQLFFDNNGRIKDSTTILLLMEEEYNIDEDTAFTRYEFWRRAITVMENGCDIVKIDDVAIIVIDEYDNFYYGANPNLFKK